MALFKTFRGKRTDLDSVVKIDGHAYFCMDDGTFWIDYKDAEEVKRKQINKEDWTKDIEAAIAALKLEFSQIDVGNSATPYEIDDPQNMETTISINLPNIAAEQLKQIWESKENSPVILWTDHVYNEYPARQLKIAQTNIFEHEDYPDRYYNIYLKGRFEFGDTVIRYCADKDFTQSAIVEVWRDLNTIDRTSIKNEFGTVKQSIVDNAKDTYAKIDKVYADIPGMAREQAETQFIKFITQNTPSEDGYGQLTNRQITDIYYYHIVENNYVCVSGVAEKAYHMVDICPVISSAALDGYTVISVMGRNKNGEYAIYEYKTEGSNENKLIAPTIRGLDKDEEEPAIIATLDVDEAYAYIELSDINGIIKIDWGDGAINNELSHIYINPGSYNCKIYGKINKYSRIIGLSSTVFLSRIELSNSITSIEDMSFQGSTLLKRVEMDASSIKTIGFGAFEACSRLEEIVIPKSVEEIGGGAFSECRKLSTVTFNRETPIDYNTPTFPLFMACDSLTRIYVPYGTSQTYKEKWATDGASEDILNLIVESDREAMMSDVNALKTEIEEQLVGKTDYLGTTDSIPSFTAAGAGDYCRVSTEFVYDEVTGEVAHVGDILIAVKDNPTQDKADWDLVHTELGAAPATSEEINSIFEEA